MDLNSLGESEYNAKIEAKYEKIVEKICANRTLRDIVLKNFEKVVVIVMENSGKFKRTLASQMLLKILLRFIRPSKFNRVIKSSKPNNDAEEIDEDFDIEELLSKAAYNSLHIKGGVNLKREDKEKLRFLNKKRKEREENLLDELEIVFNNNNSHLNRLKRNMIKSELIGYEIRKLKKIV